jgi:hypothetical protein
MAGLSGMAVSSRSTSRGNTSASSQCGHGFAIGAEGRIAAHMCPAISSDPVNCWDGAGRWLAALIFIA